MTRSFDNEQYRGLKRFKSIGWRLEFEGIRYTLDITSIREYWTSYVNGFLMFPFPNVSDPFPDNVQDINLSRM
jgi:hypothetical protein